MKNLKGNTISINWSDRKRGNLNKRGILKSFIGIQCNLIRNKIVNSGSFHSTGKLSNLRSHIRRDDWEVTIIQSQEQNNEQ